MVCDNEKKCKRGPPRGGKVTLQTILSVYSSIIIGNGRFAIQALREIESKIRNVIFFFPFKRISKLIDSFEKKKVVETLIFKDLSFLILSRGFSRDLWYG